MSQSEEHERLLKASINVSSAMDDMSANLYYALTDMQRRIERLVF
jgi:hypothetical protein